MAVREGACEVLESLSFPAQGDLLLCSTPGGGRDKHRSRLGAITIDCNTGDLEGAATFWSGTLGCPMVHHIGPSGDLWQS